MYNELRLLVQVLKCQSYSPAETGQGKSDERREMDFGSWGRNDVVMTQGTERRAIL